MPKTVKPHYGLLSQTAHVQQVLRCIDAEQTPLLRISQLGKDVVSETLVHSFLEHLQKQKLIPLLVHVSGTKEQDGKPVSITSASDDRAELANTLMGIDQSIRQSRLPAQLELKAELESLLARLHTYTIHLHYASQSKPTERQSTEDIYSATRLLRKQIAMMGLYHHLLHWQHKQSLIENDRLLYQAIDELVAEGEQQALPKTQWIEADDFLFYHRGRLKPVELSMK